jgi:hypothetical protein
MTEVAVQENEGITKVVPEYDQPAVQQDYFGFAETKKFIFPDGITFIEFSVMNEGQKSQFQKKTSRDLVLERQSGNARMKMDQASDRHELIKATVVSWNLVRNGVPLPQPTDPSKGRVQLDDFLTFADPRLIDELEKEIRKANPWLLGDMKSDDIKKEIANLEEMLEVALERERGEAS